MIVYYYKVIGKILIREILRSINASKISHRNTLDSNWSIGCDDPASIPSQLNLEQGVVDTRECVELTGRRDMRRTKIRLADPACVG